MFTGKGMPTNMILKRISLIIISFALALSVVPSITPVAEAAAAYEYGYALLKSDYEKIAYKAISDGIRDCNKTIEFGIAPENYNEELKN